MGIKRVWRENENENPPVLETNQSESHSGPGAKVCPPAPRPRRLYHSTRRTGTQTLWILRKWSSSGGRRRGSGTGRGWSGQRRRGKEKAKRRGSCWWRWIGRRGSSSIHYTSSPPIRSARSPAHYLNSFTLPNWTSSHPRPRSHPPDLYPSCPRLERKKTSLLRRD